MVSWHEGETKRRNGGTKGRSFEATNARRREKTNKHGRRETKEWKNWWFIQTLESVETKLGLVRSDDLNSISFSPWSSMVQSLSFSLKHEYVMFWYTPLLKSLRKLIWPVVALYSNCGEKKNRINAVLRNHISNHSFHFPTTGIPTKKYCKHSVVGQRGFHIPYLL